MRWRRDRDRIEPYRRVEVWTQNHLGTWFEMRGVTSIVSGEVAIAPNDVENMAFHDKAPTKTKEHRVWRYLDNEVHHG